MATMDRSERENVPSEDRYLPILEGLASENFSSSRDRLPSPLSSMPSEDRSSLLFRSIFVIFFLRAEVLLSLMPSEELIRLF